MTLSALFEQIDVPLADADAAATRRCTSAAPSRSTAASCCTGRSATGSRRWRSATTSASPRRRTCSRRSAAARDRRTCFVSLGYAGWSAGQLEQEIAQNAWLTVEADAGRRCSTLPRRGAAAGGDAACSASTSRACPMPSGTPDPWPRMATADRRAGHACSLSISARGGSASAIGNTRDARRAPADDHRRRGRTPRASPPSPRWSTSGSPSALVVGRPLHADGTAHEMTARARALRAPARGPLRPAGGAASTSADDAGARRRRSPRRACRGPGARDAARRATQVAGAADPAGHGSHEPPRRTPCARVAAA